MSANVKIQRQRDEADYDAFVVIQLQLQSRMHQNLPHKEVKDHTEVRLAQM